jgi:voltage-gated potassium channel
MTLRDRYNAFIERHDVAWELTFAVLAVVYVAVGFMADGATPDQAAVLTAVDAALTGIFVAEFSTRIYAARDRRRYLRAHWIDLVALIPAIREVRVLRLLRLLRLVRAFAGIYRALQHFERLARHRGLAALYTAWLAVMVICSILLYAAENGINEAVSSPFDALWWGIVTITTVGYGDVYPVTAEGRIAAAVLMLLGIGLFSAITATITSFMLTDRGPDSAAAGDLDSSLTALHEAGILTDAEYAAKRARLARG